MKKYKVAIIGAGQVGTQAASLMVRDGLCDVSLVDINGNLAKGKAQDLGDFSSFHSSYISIRGYKHTRYAKDADIVVITAGLRRSPGMDRRDLINKNASIVKEISRTLKKTHFRGIVIVVSNPLDVMTYVASKTLGLSRGRVVGMGQLLDTQRLRFIIASRLKVNPSSVHTMVIGEHGKFMVPLFSRTFVGPNPIYSLLKQGEIRRIQEELIFRGASIVSFLGKGSAYSAPGAGIYELVRGIILDERKIMPVSIYLKGEFKQHDICIGYPCLISSKGATCLQFSLSPQEKKDFLKACQSLKEYLDAL